nr:MAG TPA: hypothetical protein [Caudoviricetes sp.]
MITCLFLVYQFCRRGNQWKQQRNLQERAMLHKMAFSCRIHNFELKSLLNCSRKQALFV